MHSTFIMTNKPVMTTTTEWSRLVKNKRLLVLARASGANAPTMVVFTVTGLETPLA
jgi:hypothetical protein